MGTSFGLLNTWADPIILHFLMLDNSMFFRTPPSSWSNDVGDREVTMFLGKFFQYLGTFANNISTCV